MNRQLPVMMALAVLAAASASSVSADHGKIDVTITPAASSSGCAAADECLSASEVAIDVNGEVIWTNESTSTVVILSGTLEEADGIIESGPIGSGESFSFQFTEPGTYTYFSSIQPWMQGTVIVEGEHGDGHTDEETHDDDHGGEATHPVSIDEVMATVETGDAAQDSPLSVDVAFTDLDGTPLEHVNYDIKATQGGQVILDDRGAHSHTGSGTHSTAPLPADASEDMPVGITVELLGFGVDEITGPSGQVATKQVVPEFGTIAVAVLGIAVVSIIALNAKSRIFSRPDRRDSARLQNLAETRP